MIIKEIKKLLKKYYILYDSKQWEHLSINNIKESFNKYIIHDGYYPKNDMIKFNPPKYLPYYNNNNIIIPEIASNDIKFQQKYVDTLNIILLDSDMNKIRLDFRNNYGGKPQVMIAGLLPLFNMSKKKY
jgi:hypothetical protein